MFRSVSAVVIRIHFECMALSCAQFFGRDKFPRLLRFIVGGLAHFTDNTFASMHMPMGYANRAVVREDIFGNYWHRSREYSRWAVRYLVRHSWRNIRAPMTQLTCNTNFKRDVGLTDNANWLQNKQCQYTHTHRRDCQLSSGSYFHSLRIVW